MLRFTGRRIDHHIKVGNGSYMAMQDDSDTAGDDIANAFPFEPGEDVGVSLRICLVHHASLPASCRTGQS
jgi:hypothetical protein